MALSYKEMMFECILNNESSSSLKTIKSKKIYQKTHKSYDISFKKSYKQKSLKKISNKEIKETTDDPKYLFDNKYSSYLKMLQFYRNYKSIKNLYNNLNNIIIATKKNEEKIHLYDRRLVEFGPIYSLLYSTDYYMLSGSDRLSKLTNEIESFKNLVKDNDNSDVPDFILKNLKRLKEFYNSHVKNNEIVINDYKLIPFVNNDLLSINGINLYDILNRYFKYFLNSYEEKIIGFYIINDNNDFNYELVKKSNDTLIIQINNTFYMLNQFNRSKLNKFSLFLQHTKETFNNDNKVENIKKLNLITNFSNFNIIDNSVFIKYVYDNLIEGGSIILFLMSSTPIKSKLTEFICKKFKKIIITKTTFSAQFFWVLIGQGYNHYKTYGDDKKIMNFINESQKKVALKIECFLNNVYNEINNFSNRVLIKEINKRYIEIYEWALHNNIELINIFSDKDKTPKLMSKKNMFNYLFPIKQNVDRNKLQLFNVSIYSVTPPNEAEMISKTIKNLVSMVSHSKLHTRIIITDGTANVGGNTINFSLNFPEVNTIEIDKNVFAALKYNCQDVYKLKNINYYHDDCLNIIPKLKQDVIFIDPPWNGILYKAYEKLELYLGKQNIKDVIKFWYQHNYAKLYVIKCPFNYDFEYYITEYTNTYIQKIRNYNIIYLFNL